MEIAEFEETGFLKDFLPKLLLSKPRFHPKPRLVKIVSISSNSHVEMGNIIGDYKVPEFTLNFYNSPTIFSNFIYPQFQLHSDIPSLGLVQVSTPQYPIANEAPKISEKTISTLMNCLNEKDPKPVFKTRSFLAQKLNRNVLSKLETEQSFIILDVVDIPIRINPFIFESCQVFKLEETNVTFQPIDCKTLENILIYRFPIIQEELVDFEYVPILDSGKSIDQVLTSEIKHLILFENFNTASSRLFSRPVLEIPRIVNAPESIVELLEHHVSSSGLDWNLAEKFRAKEALMSNAPNVSLYSEFDVSNVYTYEHVQESIVAFKDQVEIDLKRKDSILEYCKTTGSHLDDFLDLRKSKKIKIQPKISRPLEKATIAKPTSSKSKTPIIEIISEPTQQLETIPEFVDPTPQIFIVSTKFQVSESARKITTILDKTYVASLIDRDIEPDIVIDHKTCIIFHNQTVEALNIPKNYKNVYIILELYHSILYPFTPPSTNNLFKLIKKCKDSNANLVFSNNPFESAFHVRFISDGCSFQDFVSQSHYESKSWITVIPTEQEMFLRGLGVNVMAALIVCGCGSLKELFKMDEDEFQDCLGKYLGDYCGRLYRVIHRSPILSKLES